MFARIYQPAKTAMSSGTAKTKHWVLEFAQSDARHIDPLMGWTSSDDTQTQVRLQFDTRDAAVDYADRHGIQATVLEPQKRAANIRSGGWREFCHQSSGCLDPLGCRHIWSEMALLSPWNRHFKSMVS